MSDFNFPNFINKYNAAKQAQQNDFKTGQPTSSAGKADAKFQVPKEVVVKNIVQKAILQNTPANGFRNILTYDFKMNHLESMGKSLYMKDLMNLPKEMEEALLALQNNTKTAESAKLLMSNIDISTLAELMQRNGKEAMNKLVLTMAEASKQGITDTSQLKDAIKYINASVSVAGKDNPNLIIKNFMLMYLPWLPLREGVDFDLEIEGSLGGEDSGDETSITIMISTVNYGNVKVTLVLEAQNAMNIIVNCSEEFPKQELLKRIDGEAKLHAIQSNVAFEQNSAKPAELPTRQAKVSMSTLTQVNPFLLLMTNAVIRHTIELDNEKG